MPGFDLSNVKKGLIGVLFYKDLAMSGGVFINENLKNPFVIVGYKEDEEILVVSPETETGNNKYFVRPGYYTGIVAGIRFDVEITEKEIIIGYSDEEKADNLVIYIP